ncbi:putative nuclease HARBI1 [Aplochiton taeniatus]
MCCPFMREFLIDEGANIVRRAFRRERVFKDRHDPLGHSDIYLHERYRFSREGIIYLQQVIGRHIANCTERSAALTVTQMLCIGLRFFATGTFLFAVGDAENISKSTVCRAIRKVYLALKRYLNVFITFPGHAKVNTIKEGFCAVAGFPNVLGVVDSVHIPIKAPTGPFLLTPFVDPTPGPKARFNQALAKTWTKMETTCSLLKGRFQCLDGLRVAPDRACDIIVACAVLHNIATLRRERAPHFQQPAQDDAEPVCLDQPSGTAARDQMAAQYFC